MTSDIEAADFSCIHANIKRTRDRQVSGWTKTRHALRSSQITSSNQYFYVVLEEYTPLAPSSILVAERARAIGRRRWKRIRTSPRFAAAALQRALVYSAPYISAGMWTRQLTWFLPRLVEFRDPDAVLCQAASLGLTDARSFSQVKDSVPWRKAMTEPAPVQRVWGPIAPFWSLLIERLESRQPLKSCERCGRPLKGTGAKRFCSQKENLECFHRRRATDRRR
jgi:hypothetical protein